MKTCGAHPAFLPDATFYMRVHDPAGSAGPNPYRWDYRTARDLFGGKRVVLVGVPGAFSPTCSDAHLPELEREYAALRAAGADEVWCTAVNDAFAMFRWAEALGVSKVRMLPDGNGDLARGMGMLVSKRNRGFGARSWRYAAVVDDMRIVAMFEEAGKMDECPADPFGVSSVRRGVLPFLRAKREKETGKGGSRRRAATAPTSKK